MSESKKRRSSAEDMARDIISGHKKKYPAANSSQRTDICSPLNYCRDNPRKALLTTVKEAVDNSLDACEESGKRNSESHECTPGFPFSANLGRITTMSTLHLSDTLLDGYVALFHQLAPRDQTILLNKLTETVSIDVPVSCVSLEKVADPSGVEAARQVFGAWGGEENREDVNQMIQAIAENRMWEREVQI